MSSQTKVHFDSSASAWGQYLPNLLALLARHGPRSVCELGGGANPALSLDTIRALEIECTLLDISGDELAKAPQGYRKLEADICAPAIHISQRYDFVFSRMLLEHVADGWQFHRNVHQILTPSGVAFHFFPTLYCGPFLANWLIRPAWSQRLLDAFAPRDPLREQKFAAHYSACRGPTSRQIRRLESLGYEVLEYRGFFGHNYYARVPLVRSVQRMLSGWLVEHPLPWLTSYAYLVLGKPALATAEASHGPPARCPRTAA